MKLICQVCNISNNYLICVLTPQYHMLYHVSVIRRRLYQYGTAHDDKTLMDDDDKSCDPAGKACSSSFIKTPLIQVFDSQFRTIKVIAVLI